SSSHVNELMVEGTTPQRLGVERKFLRSYTYIFPPAASPTCNSSSSHVNELMMEGTTPQRLGVERKFLRSYTFM
ncbi:hypothetical protein SFRURICE_007773, partial [Spodoptera frugiperda]